MATDEWAIKLLTLFIELLRSCELPELAAAGAWYCAQSCVIGRPAVGSMALELGMFELAAVHLRELGSPAVWLVRHSRLLATRQHTCD
jgi:hypothetical protein